ncbi:hypothetical protein P879_04878 [Paragonimus westermani]|uniref:Uncharacterized protein n=1 Tax=Paragonimus westermani TaxID=34504 RepID=A0A8T0DLD8_9TREM|nr:hypothetical protein P879_04878 [Paragonimus westermani]
MNATPTCFEAKLIGRRFDDVSVVGGMKYWPFTVIFDGGKTKVRVEFESQKKTFVPEETPALVLTKMRGLAQVHVGKKIKDTVLTEIANFKNSHPQATKDAAVTAGLTVLWIINEPTAAMIAYGPDKKIATERHVLAFDLSVDAFDVTAIPNCSLPPVILIWAAKISTTAW